MTNKTDLIKKIPIFSCLSEQDLTYISDIAEDKFFSKNTLLIGDGDETTCLYIVIEGKAQAVSIDVQGRQLILNEFGPGDYFGEMSFIDGKPRCANIELKTRCRVLKIPKKKFQKLFTDNPDLVFQFMGGLSEKVRKLTRQVEELVFLNAYERLVIVLKRLEREENGQLVIREKLTHQQLSDMIGTSREMISRIFKDLIEGGYISREKKVIRILKSLPAAY